MAEKEDLSVGNGQSTVAQSAQSAPALPSAGTHSVLQDRLSLTPLDSNSDRVVQPFPRSPKLQKKMANAGQLSQVKKSEGEHSLMSYSATSSAHYNIAESYY